MATYHTVQQGEYLANIVRRYGFTDYRVVYDHPENAEFKRKRPNPNLVHPGDRLFIPDVEERVEVCPTQQRHRFKFTVPRVQLRLALKGGQGEVLASKPYTLTAGTAVLEGTTDAQGVIDASVPADSEQATLDVWPSGGKSPDNEHLTWTLLIGHLDPVEEVTGVQARLNNLGYEAGPAEGIVGPRTQAAIRAFQRDNDLPLDGVASAQLQQKLKEVYGC